jgi:hypothetical protein
VTTSTVSYDIVVEEREVDLTDALSKIKVKQILQLRDVYGSPRPVALFLSFFSNTLLLCFLAFDFFCQNWGMWHDVWTIRPAPVTSAVSSNRNTLSNTRSSYKKSRTFSSLSLPALSPSLLSLFLSIIVLLPVQNVSR